MTTRRKKKERETKDTAATCVCVTFGQEKKKSYLDKHQYVVIIVLFCCKYASIAWNAVTTYLKKNKQRIFF